MFEAGATRFGLMKCSSETKRIGLDGDEKHLTPAIPTGSQLCSGRPAQERVAASILPLREGSADILGSISKLTMAMTASLFIVFLSAMPLHHSGSPSRRNRLNSQ